MGKSGEGMEVMTGGRAEGVAGIGVAVGRFGEGGDLTDVRGPSTFEGLCSSMYHWSFFVFEAYAHDQPTRP